MTYLNSLKSTISYFMFQAVAKTYRKCRNARLYEVGAAASCTDIFSTTGKKLLPNMFGKKFGIQRLTWYNNLTRLYHLIPNPFIPFLASKLFKDLPRQKHKIRDPPPTRRYLSPSTELQAKPTASVSPRSRCSADVPLSHLEYQF